MSNCQQCNAELPNDARFCPQCGTQHFQHNVPCPACDGLNTTQTIYCIHCGEAMKLIADTAPITYKTKYPLDFGERVRIPVQIRTYFLKALQQRLKSDGVGAIFDQYLGVFYDSDFGKTFDQRARSLAEEYSRIHADQTPDALWLIDQHLIKAFEGMLDEFILTEGKELHPGALPDKVLEYNDLPNSSLGLQQMIVDYLDLKQGEEKWYTDFEKMPTLKLENAQKTFLFSAKEERILLIYDQTVFGSCREGFAMTEKGLYWNAHFKDSQQIFYNEVDDLINEPEYLKINGKYFNVNPSLNVKMMYLLRKLKGFKQ